MTRESAQVEIHAAILNGVGHHHFNLGFVVGRNTVFVFRN